MFARSFRPVANQLRSQVRRYATEPKKGGMSTSVLVGVGAVTVGSAVYFAFATDKIGQETAAQATKGLQKTKPTFTGGDQGFVSLVLKEVETINHNTKKFRFELPGSDYVSGLPVASALISKYKGPEMEKPVIRPYTPVSDENQPGSIDFIIKKYPNGPMSSHMHDMSPGQQLEFKGPIPKYPWTPQNHVVMIAGGTGITPMYQVMRKIFSDPEADKTQVTLLYGSVSEEDILLKKELEDLENTFPQRFRAFYVLDNPPSGWTKGQKGHITKEMIKTLSPEPKEENIKVFVCGPPGLYKAISGTKKSPSDQGELSGYLKELGYSKEQVYKF